MSFSIIQVVHLLSSCLPRDSDSESSGSGPVDLSLLGCGSVAGDSDWDSDLSDSDPSRSSRVSAAGSKSLAIARPKRLPAEPGWDLFGETTEPEVLSELFTEQDQNNNGKSRKSTGVTTSIAATPGIPLSAQPVISPVRQSTTEQASTTKKVTWQFKPAQRSVCTGSRKEREKEVTSSSSSSVRFMELGGAETHRPPPSSSSSSSSSPSSSSSGWPDEGMFFCDSGSGFLSWFGNREVERKTCFVEPHRTTTAFFVWIFNFAFSYCHCLLLISWRLHKK